MKGWDTRQGPVIGGGQSEGVGRFPGVVLGRSPGKRAREEEWKRISSTLESWSAGESPGLAGMPEGGMGLQKGDQRGWFWRAWRAPCLAFSVSGMLWLRSTM